MCQYCNDPAHKMGIEMPDRRKFLLGGATMAAAAVVTPIAGAMAQKNGQEPFNTDELDTVTAYGVQDSRVKFEKLTIKRRRPLADDVVIDIHSGHIV